MKQILFSLLMLVFVAVQMGAQTTVNITDADLQPNQTYNWTKNNVYLLDGVVFLESGSTLNIEAGTVVKFTARADVGNPSALVVTTGATINANGTAQEPIIFTAEADDVNNPSDLGPTDRSLWGGLVILGNGVTQKNGISPVQVEGIPTSEPRGLYGGSNNADNSGVLRYVSIRHGGREIAPGNELNGLTLGAVGSGTTLEYIEVYANSDDGIEFFGGAPNLKYAAVVFAEDDSFDWDEVYTGKGQFWFSLQRSDVADSGGELDGTTPDDGTPVSNPTVYNWTHIGSGPNGTTSANQLGLNFRAGTGGTLANSIITSTRGKALVVQDKAAGVNDAYSKLASGELKILNNLFFENGAFTNLDATSTGILAVSGTAEDATASALITHLTTNKNIISNPQIQGISRIADGNLDPRPTGNTAVTTDLAAYPTGDAFFTKVNYKGAFPAFAAGQWLSGWSTLARNGHLKNLSNPQTVFVNDASIKPCDNITWTKDKTYIVDGLTFVDSCATLTIEAGTVVKFTPRADVGNPSALVIARGAKLFANGTAEEPIIFTAEDDDVNNPNDLGPTDRSLWGGLVILGSGVTQKNGTTPVQVEGIPTTEKRGLYGGNNNADNSGVLRYVSIRHGGREIAPGNELNGLTLGAVGSGTTLEYVEVYANSDDGIEFFGGSPNLKYAIVAFAEDDSYDWDEVYTGKGQFWFSLQRSDVADAGGELDGSTPDDLTPFSNPTVYNWTHIGSGPNGTTSANQLGLNFRAGTGGTLANSIITSTRGKALVVQDKAAGVNDAYNKLASGDLKILNNLFFENGAFTTLDATSTGVLAVSGTAEDATASALISHLTTNKNAISNPQIQGISRIADGNLDPRPAGNTAVTTDLAAYPAGDQFFTQVNYKGAFPPFAAGQWARGWSTLARNGHLKDLNAGGQLVFVNDASIKPCDNVTWTKDKTYVVDGLTFVDSCATLTIEAGTVVKFTPRADVGNPSALIVARGAKIFANGTANEPIIFTAEADDVNNPTDLGPTDRSLWGGIVLLGSGITQKNGASPVQVEGIPTTEKRGLYGGTNNADNSGALRYISIRHGGREIAPGNELNGLTLGAVGSGTTLEYVEIYANSDDGIEFFGGAPALKYAVVAFAEDDSYDWDEIYVGKGQFWFSIQRSDVADAGGELDGSTPDDLTPYSNPSVYNWTHIGSGQNGTTSANQLGWNLRAGTAGVIANSVMVDTRGKALVVQDKAAGANDAYSKLLNGELRLLNNVFSQIGSFTLQNATSNGIIAVSGTAEDATATALVNHLETNQTSMQSPYIRQISRTQDAQLDPRPCTIGSAYSTPLAAVPGSDPFFTTVNYKGAFANDWSQLWIRNWTTLARNGHLVTTPVEACPLVNTNDLDGNLLNVFRIYPNPTSQNFMVESKFDAAVNVEIFDLAGRLVSQRMSLAPGTQQVTINELKAGMYLIKFTTEDGKNATKRLIVE
jgi:plastocyanin